MLEVGYNILSICIKRYHPNKQRFINKCAIYIEVFFNIYLFCMLLCNTYKNSNFDLSNSFPLFYRLGPDVKDASKVKYEYNMKVWKGNVP